MVAMVNKFHCDEKTEQLRNEIVPYGLIERILVKHRLDKHSVSIFA